MTTDKDREPDPSCAAVGRNLGRQTSAQARVERALLESEARQGFLLNLFDSLRALADPVDLQRTTCSLLGLHLRADRVYYGEKHVEDGTIVIPADYCRGGLDSVRGLYATASVGEEPAVLGEGRPLVVTDGEASTAISDRSREVRRLLGIGASITVPLVAAGRVVRALTVACQCPRQWTNDEVALVEEVAHRTWGAVEHVRAEVSLRQSEARFRALIEAFAQAVWETDAAGVAVADSPSWRAYTGQTLNEFLGNGWVNAVHPEDREYAERQWREATKSGQPLNAEFRLRGPDGGWRWTNVRAAPIRDPDGKIGKWVGMNIDITDRKNTEHALCDSLFERDAARAQLERSHRRLSEILESIQDDFYVLDRDWRFLFASRSFTGKVGKRPEDFLGRNLWDLLPKYLGSVLEDNFRAAMDRREIRRFEAEGRYTDAIYHMTVFPSADGITVLGTDVTRQKQAEDAIRRSERLLRDVIDGSPNLAVFLKDRDGRFLAVNSYLERLLGKTQAELAGKTDYDLFPKDVADAYRAVDRQVQDSGEAMLVEEEADLLDGHHTFLASKFPLRDSAGAIYGIGAISHDITERKRMQRELERAKQDLEEANQRKNEFLAVLSHELRNPLTPVKNSLYILERATPGSEQARRAKQVLDRQVDQLVRLVDDLLDITRITRGKVQLQRSCVALHERVRETLEDHHGLLEAAEVQVRLVPAAQEVYVDADGNRIAQVLGNLLHNAAKFTPPGGTVTVAVSTEPATRQALLRVTDTGAGWSRDLGPRLFQPFMQADRTLDRSKGGLGLGLALVKALVELHGGSVEARSEGIGQGAEFVVRLPLADGPSATDRPGQTPALPAGKRVLIIEDNVDAAESLRDVLEMVGHTVAVAFSGPAGLASARQAPPDVVLCDIGLPGMDGYELARAFRADGQLRHVRLVALSGYALPEDLERALAAGFERHVAKPASLDKLAEVLGQAPVPPP